MKLKYSFALIMGFGILLTGVSFVHTRVAFASSASLDIVASINNSIFNRVEGMVVEGSYAYVAGTDADTFSIVDISNPLQPSVVGSLNSHISLDGVWGVQVQGNYAFVTAVSSDVFAAIDISNKTAPTIVDTVGVNNARSFVLDQTGNYAIVPSYEDDTMVIVDISDPNNLAIEATSIPSANLDGVMDVARYGDYIFALEFGSSTGVGNGAGGDFTVLNLQNPIPSSTAPVVNTAIPWVVSRGRGLTVSSDGQTAYLVASIASSNYFTTVDISDPNNPAVLASLPVGQGAVRLSANGDYAFVTDTGNDTVHVIDIADAANPHIVISTTDSRLDGARWLDVSGEYVYVGTTGSQRFVVLKFDDGLTSQTTSNPTSSPVSSNRFAVLSRAKQQVARVRGENTTPCTSVVGNCLIAQMQTYLISQGHGVGMPIDGIMGPKTQAALESFKAAH